jgi:hypothetical protein
MDIQHEFTTQQLSVTVPMLKRETSVELAYDEVVRVD